MTMLCCVVAGVWNESFCHKTSCSALYNRWLTMGLSVS